MLVDVCLSISTMMPYSFKSTAPSQLLSNVAFPFSSALGWRLASARSLLSAMWTSASEKPGALYDRTVTSGAAIAWKPIRLEATSIHLAMETAILKCRFNMFGGSKVDSASIELGDVVESR